MAVITSFDSLDNEIKKMPGKPVVLEALWDGDTSRWFLLINLYCEPVTGAANELYSENLGVITLGGDIRLFNGQVPPWPEAELAKELGRKATEKYGLTFYFPSGQHPDDQCPDWEQRHLAIQCAGCGKLIIPTTSQYLPKDICYNCYLKRELKDKAE